MIAALGELCSPEVTDALEFSTTVWDNAVRTNFVKRKHLRIVSPQQFVADSIFEIVKRTCSQQVTIYYISVGKFICRVHFR